MLEHILPYIEGKLRLKVNREKTVVAYIGRIKLLGYGFYPSKDGIKLRTYPRKERQQDESKGKRAHYQKQWVWIRIAETKAETIYHGLDQLFQTRSKEQMNGYDEGYGCISGNDGNVFEPDMQCFAKSDTTITLLSNSRVQEKAIGGLPIAQFSAQL